MSLHRVRQRLGRMLAEHEEGERDGHEPTAQAHATLAAHLREDIAAIERALADLDDARRERDEAVARAERAEAALAEMRDRDEHDRMVVVLRRIATWRSSCHENDRSMGLEERTFGAADVAWIETLASRALRGAPLHRSIADTEAAAEAHDRRVRAEALRENEKAADEKLEERTRVVNWLMCEAFERRFAETEARVYRAAAAAIAEGRYYSDNGRDVEDSSRVLTDAMRASARAEAVESIKDAISKLEAAARELEG